MDLSTPYIKLDKSSITKSNTTIQLKTANNLYFWIYFFQYVTPKQFLMIRFGSVVPFFLNFSNYYKRSSLKTVFHIWGLSKPILLFRWVTDFFLLWAFLEYWSWSLAKYNFYWTFLWWFKEPSSKLTKFLFSHETWNKFSDPKWKWFHWFS